MRAAADLGAHETVALPLLLWTLLELEVDDELSDAAARRLAELLPADFLAGDALRWKGGTSPEARRRDRLVLRRWLTLWELHCSRPEVLQVTLLAEPPAATPPGARALALRALCLEVYTRYRRWSD